MMTHDEAVEFIATYALDAVEENEREAIEAHLLDCPRCRIDLDGYRAVTTALGNSVEQPPEGLWTSIANRLPERGDVERPPMPALVLAGDLEDQAPPSSLPIERQRRARGRTAAVIGAFVGAAAVVAVLAVSLVHANNQVSNLQHSIGGNAPSAVVAALETPGHKIVNVEGPSHAKLAQFVMVPDGRGYLVSSSLPILTGDHTYQLWGVVEGQPISLGLLGPSPTQATFTVAGSASPSTLGITVEPAGGAVVPSQAMVAQGTI